jgi:DME family drug/metabolite transporter
MRDSSRSRLQVLGAAVFFSTGGVGIKLTSLSGLEVAAWRSAVAAIVLWLLIPSWRRFWKPRPMLVGVFYAATLICFVVATKYTMAANAIFLQSTAPIYVLLLAPWFLGEPNRRSDYFITVILMLGLGLFFVDAEPATDTAPDPMLGNWLAIASGLALAFVLMGLRWLARDRRSEGDDETGAAALAGNFIAVLVCAPLILPTSFVSLRDVLLIGYLGSVQIAFGYWILTRGLPRVPAVEVSMLLLAEPVLNAVWAWMILGEEPGPWSIAGCLFIMSATCARLAINRGDEVAIEKFRND